MKLKLLSFLLFPAALFAQGYTSYFTGSTTNITTIPEFGVCLMGGATEHDNAMAWLLEKANGGDVVVLRCSGSNGYNNYMYSELGVSLNSVETLVITSEAGATSPYVLNKIANAELIWFAGGDQWNYVNFFKDNALEDLLNAHVNEKGAPIGGTSAGMAILGGRYFSAQNGSVTSAEALTDPFNPYMTVMYDDFLSVPYLTGVITDTHYDNPDRRGRHAAFLARLMQFSTNVYGIACNEYVAVCVNQSGIAHVFGDYPNYQEFAYFIQDNCHNTNGAETIQAGTPLTWDYNGQALQVYKVPGTMDGEHWFDLGAWGLPVASGGNWEDWSVINGSLQVVAGEGPDCVLSAGDHDKSFVQILNPVDEVLQISQSDGALIRIYDQAGRAITNIAAVANRATDVSALPPGTYIVEITRGGATATRKIVKR
ncbi:MAG TPA: T9SS type A sorting domain-containing protein [Flavobacterium sp.]|jgi:cyanophycinase-like exopeptidase